METKDLIIIICAIIVGACIIAGTIYITGGSSDNKDNTTATNATENITNNNTSVENVTSGHSASNSKSTHNFKTQTNNNKEDLYYGPGDSGEYYYSKNGPLKGGGYNYNGIFYNDKGIPEGSAIGIEYEDDL